ncbi:MAG: ATP synthase F1 subunit delta [Candidatus Omnitrophica bacterium]|nr:ATP synthase F1 subunit delta [Candidatus Omnitrophota bacterium]
MIKDRVIVIRYAQAFIGYVRDGIGVEQALVDIRTLRNLIRDNFEFKEFLDSADITAYEKEQLLEKVLKNEISLETINFLRLLLEKKRIVNFSDIAEYLLLTYAHEGEEEALLRTSLPLDIGLVKRIEEKLSERYGKKFKFYIDLDGSLLGGVQVVIGNTILDGSVRKRLLDLKEKLKEIEVN